MHREWTCFPFQEARARPAEVRTHVDATQRCTARGGNSATCPQMNSVDHRSAPRSLLDAGLPTVSRPRRNARPQVSSFFPIGFQRDQGTDPVGSTRVNVAFRIVSDCD